MFCGKPRFSHAPAFLTGQSSLIPESCSDTFKRFGVIRGRSVVLQLSASHTSTESLGQSLHVTGPSCNVHHRGADVRAAPGRFSKVELILGGKQDTKGISGCGPIKGLGVQTGCNDHKDVKGVIRAEAAVLTQRNRSESVDIHTVMTTKPPPPPPSSLFSF